MDQGLAEELVPPKEAFWLNTCSRYPKVDKKFFVGFEFMSLIA